jgi:hypothetical protein
MLKKRAAGDNPDFRMSPGGYLLCSAQASPPSTSFSQILSLNAIDVQVL